MIAKQLWDQARSDRRVVPVMLGVLVLLGVLAHLETGRAAFAVFAVLLGAYLVVLGLRDRGALLAFVGSAAGVSVVLLLYALMRRR